MFTLKVWRKNAPFYLKFLYEIMPRQMKAVVDAQGGHTKQLMYISHGICFIYWINWLYLKKVTNFDLDSTYISVMDEQTRQTRTNGWMDRWIDRRTDRWTDRPMDGRFVLKSWISLTLYYHTVIVMLPLSILFLLLYVGFLAYLQSIWKDNW